MSLSDLLRGLTKDDLAILGEIAVSMSSLEHMVQAVIWWLLNLSVEKGLIVTGPLALNQKTEMLAALAKGLSAEASKTLKNIITDIDIVRPERNRKLHAVWRHNENMEKIALTLGKDRRSIKETKVVTKDLEDARDAIKRVEFSLIHWFIGYAQAHPSSQGKSE